ncbi:hypothetical protein ACJ41O_010307 [Fusarium nematophilum]
MANTVLCVGAEGPPIIRRDMPTPQLTEGEVLIQVLFSGVNPSDLRMPERLGCRNRVLGIDFCGRVLETAGLLGHSGFEVGDVVAGYMSGNGNRPLRYGTHQSQVSIPPMGLFKVPQSMPLPDAACFMTVVQTANDALYNRLELPLPSSSPTPIEGTLVIWGGSTAVGMSALQLALARGVASIIPARPAEAEKMWKAVEWVREKYGKCFKLLGLRVFEGTAESALEEAIGVSRQAPLAN